LPVIAAGLLLFFFGVNAQDKEHQSLRPSIHYLLKADTAHLLVYEVEIQLCGLPHHFRLAMATHHEYDDRPWRDVKDFHVETDRGKATFQRTDSAVWDITAPGDEATVSYSVALRGGPRFAHQPFLSPGGGLLGDLHSFMYVAGHTGFPVTVSFALPRGWQIATGLQRTAGANTYIAPSAAALLDCPILTGHLRQWEFTVNGIPHTIAWLPVADTTVFDTAALVGNIKKIVVQTIRLFGNIPYKNYAFLLEDGVYGALEHGNSVTIGAPAVLLASHMSEIYEEIAHEFSHTWNLMYIRPAEYTALNYGPQQQSAGLWFSEGMAMYYADLLVRRAGLPCEDSTRSAHLESLIRRYYTDTGNRVFPPAVVSVAANAPPGPLGDYMTSTHLQGELLGTMLDLLIIDATDGRKSMDNVMALMNRRFGGKSGFYAVDIEKAVNDICGSDKMHSFFRQYVYAGKALDFDSWLRYIGLRLQLSYSPARDDQGQPKADTRIYVRRPFGDSAYHLVMADPRSCWVRAGLHTGDAIKAFDDRPVNDRQGFYTMLGRLRPGDRVTVEIDRAGTIQRVPVLVTGYETAIAQLIKMDNTGIKVKKLNREWTRGAL
jgi:predicted metalloprotease with PDZ domain